MDCVNPMPMYLSLISVSYGGYCIGFPDSGAFQFQCFVPGKLADSSAAAEAIVACHCVKAIVAARMLAEELGLKQCTPTPLAMDASAVIDGAKMERVSRTSRWLAARQAILREMIAGHITRLVKVGTDTHNPDIFTKPVADALRFRLLRDGLLGRLEWIRRRFEQVPEVRAGRSN